MREIKHQFRVLFNRVIPRFGNIPWSRRSPDPTMCGFFLTNV